MAITAFLRTVWADFIKTSGLEPALLDKLKITRVSPGIVHLNLPLEKKHTNRLQILHGGTIASIVDLGGSLAVASKGLHSTGVSTDISITYLSSGGKIGEDIHIKCTCDKIGRTLAFTSIELFNADRSKLFARGTHTKYVKDAYKDPKNQLELGKSKSDEQLDS